MKLEFCFGGFEKNNEILSFMKIHSVGAELLIADGRTDMTQRTVALHNSANAHDKTYAYRMYTCFVFVRSQHGLIYCIIVTSNGGRCSSVGIATSYGLDGPGIESRWGARFSAPFQTDPEAHPATCAVGAERGVDYPPSSSDVKERV